MNLSIISPTGKLFNGEVHSVMLPGTLGPFQVLPNHAPVVSSLTAGKITYTVGATSSSVSVSSGFTSIADNQVMVVCEPIEW
ncbi:F0F1 ATP synthase subunit epsilon [Cardinium endosymbiont of Philonthus spinipes]|uniref:FoF1 ATP synthase subunit delta/epsilon n=1 Tax=Cardinium endosymbiont of Philonthus spinipes TaxID=3077941 RepID=UPI00313B0282